LDGVLDKDKLKGVTQEDMAKAIYDIGAMVKEDRKRIDETDSQAKTKSESLERFEKQLGDLGKMFQEFKKQRPPDPHVNELQGAYAARKGGLFKKGAPTLPYEELLRLSPSADIVRGEDQELLKDLQDSHDAVVFKHSLESIVHKVDMNPRKQAIVEERTFKGRDFKRFQDLVTYTGYAKVDEIIHPSTGGMANPLTMSLVSGRVADLVRINLNVANQFPEYPMQNWDEKIPVNTLDSIGVRGGAADSDPPPKDIFSSPVPAAGYFGSIGFNQAALQTEDVLHYLIWNDRAVSDTVIAMVPYLRNMIAFGHARAIDRACMSGDIAGRVAGSHMDDHASAFLANDARSLWNGLRRIGENNYTDLGGVVIDSDDVKASAKRMGVYGTDKAQMRLWMNTGPAWDMMGDPDVMTIDKWGPSATLRTGQLAMIWGIPILPTEWIPTDLDGATGVSTAIGTETAAVLARVDRYVLGVFGATRIETTRIAPQLSTVIQAAGAFDFVPLEAVDGSEVFAGTGGLPVDIMGGLLG
jgi:hypothetical protein